MSQPNNKIPAYLEQRIAGLPPREAALAAGYAAVGIGATCSRLESRDDVRKALRAAKRQTVIKGKPTKRLYRSVADEPEVLDTAPLDPWKLRDKYESPLALMIDVMNNPKAPGGLRIQCAKDAMPYCHARKEGGKKEDAKNAAVKTAARSKFATPAAPTHLRRAA